MTGFIIYAAFCALFYLIAVYALISKKPIGLKSRERRRSDIKDAKGYNRAAAKLFIAYGTVLLLCGLPTVLDIDPMAATLISTMGVSVSVVALFVGAVKIESKYRGK